MLSNTSKLTNILSSLPNSPLGELSALSDPLPASLLASERLITYIAELERPPLYRVLKPPIPHQPALDSAILSLGRLLKDEIVITSNCALEMSHQGKVFFRDPRLSEIYHRLGETKDMGLQKKKITVLTMGSDIDKLLRIDILKCPYVDKKIFTSDKGLEKILSSGLKVQEFLKENQISLESSHEGGLSSYLSLSTSKSLYIEAGPKTLLPYLNKLKEQDVNFIPIDTILITERESSKPDEKLSDCYLIEPPFSPSVLKDSYTLKNTTSEFAVPGSGARYRVRTLTHSTV